MTREEAISIIQYTFLNVDNHLNGNEPKRDAKDINEALVMAIRALSNHSLPSNLDEAAEKIIDDIWKWEMRSMDMNSSIILSESKAKNILLRVYQAGAGLRDAQTPKLPENLEDAALVSMPKPNGIESNTDFTFMQMVWMFKQGAEWMAGQGETRDDIVVTGDFDGKAHIFPIPSSEFNPGDKVVVQIRKK